MTGVTKWKAIGLFDYDDYWVVGRDVVTNGKLAFERKGKRYRVKAQAEAQAEKLNYEEELV